MWKTVLWYAVVNGSFIKKGRFGLKYEDQNRELKRVMDDGHFW